MQGAVKAFVLRMESDVYKKMKDGKEEHYREIMKTKLRDIFNKVNKFDEEYLPVLMSVYNAIEDSIDKYYDDLLKEFE